MNKRNITVTLAAVLVGIGLLYAGGSYVEELRVGVTAEQQVALEKHTVAINQARAYRGERALTWQDVAIAMAQAQWQTLVSAEQAERTQALAKKFETLPEEEKKKVEDAATSVGAIGK
jgi:hypothetical protein